MYTRCPQCRTLFKVTLAQLKARDGLVRCGRCGIAFHADQQLYALPGWLPEPAVPSAPAVNVGTDAASEPSVRPAPAARPQAGEIPVVSDLSLFQPGRRRIPRVAWALANLLLSVALVGQFAWFYRDELAANAQLRPYIARFCDVAGCELVAHTQSLPPELVQTTIAPHPRYANALRIRAMFVNRTNRPQPFPLMEVSLTDNAGRLLARRTFRASEYLERSSGAAETMAPSVAYHALLEVTNPDERAAGYEVQLLPP